MRMVVVLLCLFVSPLTHANPKPAAELRKLVDEKIAWHKDGSDAGALDDWFASGGDGLVFLDGSTDGVVEPRNLTLGGDGITKHKVSSFAARIAPDGTSAVVSYTIAIKYLVTMDDGGMYDTLSYRVSEIAKRTPEGWRVITGLWSVDNANAAVNNAAKAGKLPSLEPLQGASDKSLVDAFQKLATGPFDTAAATRKDLIAFGSGPRERTVGGASLAKAWRAAWANKIKIDSLVTSRTDTKSTLGYVIANVTLSKPSYSIPFRVLFVFERKSESEPWSVVHAHFAVPTPGRGK